MFIFLAVFVAVSTLISLRLIKENEADFPLEPIGYFYRLFLKFFQNKNLRVFLIFSFTSRLLKAYWPCITPLALLDLGISKETLSYLGGLSMFLGFLSSLLFSKLNFSSPLDLFQKTYQIQTFSFTLQTLVFYLLKNTLRPKLALIIQLLIQLIDTVSNLNFTTYSVFMNTISDPSCNGMYLSFLNAYSNIPSLIFNPFFSRLLSQRALIPSLFMLGVTLVYSWTLLPGFIGRLKRLAPRDFHLSIKKLE